MSKINRFLVQNKNVLEIMPLVRSLASKFLLLRSPLRISDLQYNTNYTTSYALLSEKNSQHFKKIMRRLEGYIGAGPIGSNKYWEYPWVLTNLRLEKGMSILDAGCGKAPLQFLLYDIGCKVFGIDPFENIKWHGINRKLAKRFGCHIEYRREGIESISYKDNTFDRVFCVSVIEHCRAKAVKNERISPRTEEDRKLQARMMDEMLRVLKQGGLLVVTVDFNIPRDNCIFESNVDVANLMSVEKTEILANRCDEALPGETGFDVHKLISNGDIDISNDLDTLQTSIGFVLRKKSQVT